jgi:hypothetical protein
MLHSNACISQFDDTSAGVPRIQIGRTYDDIFKSSVDYRICARRSASGCGTWLQSHVKRCARGDPCAEIAQTVNLTVGLASFSMMAFCHHPIVNHKDGYHGRVRTRSADPLSCFNQSSTHELFISVIRHNAGESNNTCLEGFEPPTF